MNGDNNNARSGKFIQALLVDDDKFMLEFVGDLLRELGVMNVTTAMDGAQGLAAFDRAAPKPDLILNILATLEKPVHKMTLANAMAKLG